MTDTDVRKLADALETKKWNLLLASDADGLASLFSSDVYYLHSSGLQDNRESYLQQLRDHAFLYHRIEYQVESVISLGGQAFFVTGIVNIDAKVSGIERQMHSRFLSIWRNENDGWKLVAQQTTAAPRV